MSEPTIPLGDGGLPMAPATPPIQLPAEAPAAVAALEQALRAGDREAAVREVVARWPSCVEAWARLGELAYRAERDVDAFAYFRTGYHRALDQLRRNGWRGMGFVPWAHAPNRGALRAFRGLMLASAALGEADEARRCRQLLLDSDPADPLNVAIINPGDLDARLRLRDAD